MSRILVTGDAGFIGHHVASRLLAEGQDVLGIDGMTDYYDPQLKIDRLSILKQHSGFRHMTMMLEDNEALLLAVKNYDPDVIIHLAAQAGVRYSIDHPQTYISSNIQGTFNLLEAARESRPAHLLFASTSSVYGGNQRVPFKETDLADHPVSLYAATKKSTESLAHSYAHLWGIPMTAMRFFTVYGPWGRPDMALFKFVDAIENGRAIDVYGQGQMRRDFTYVDDLVQGIVRLMERPPVAGESVAPMDSISAVAPFRSVNIAGGAPIGLLDFIDAIERAMGIRAVRNMLPMQAGDVVQTFADPSLINAMVGGIPRTDINTGVQRFVDWYRPRR